MPGWLDSLADEERPLVRRAGPPTEARAMKAVLTDERFSDPSWIFERKLAPTCGTPARWGRAFRGKRSATLRVSFAPCAGPNRRSPTRDRSASAP